MNKIGDFIDTLFYAVIIVLCVVSVYILIRWLIAFFTEKDKAIVGSREPLISGGICIVIFSVIFLIDTLTGHPEPIYGIAALVELVTLPAATLSILTPKGICRNFPLKDKYVPLSDLSYEFKDNYLAMYFSTKKNNMVKYHIGIKNIKTVKMLADWYPKHDMTNPLLPEGGDNK